MNESLKENLENANEVGELCGILTHQPLDPIRARATNSKFCTHNRKLQSMRFFKFSRCTCQIVEFSYLLTQ